MKRSRGGGSQTGGTGDVKPQILTITGDTIATDDYGVTQFILPVPRFGTSKAKSTITEMLWIEYYFVGNVADTQYHYWAFLTPQTARTDAETADQASLVVDIANINNFGFRLMSQVLTTSGVTTLNMPLRYDFTDGNGNGLLYAGDRCTLVGANISGPSAIIAKLCYRMVDVGLEEYIGLVQSLQS
jgi:hypothetical protein